MRQVIHRNSFRGNYDPNISLADHVEVEIDDDLVDVVDNVIGNGTTWYYWMLTEILREVSSQ